MLQELQSKIGPSHVEYVPRKLCMSQNTHSLNIFTYCGGHRRFSRKRIDVSKYSGSDYFTLLFVNQVVWFLTEGCLCFILNCCVTEKKILLVPMVYCLRNDSMAAPAQVVVK